MTKMKLQPFLALNNTNVWVSEMQVKAIMNQLFKGDAMNVETRVYSGYLDGKYKYGAVKFTYATNYSQGSVTLYGQEPPRNM